jgi:PAS domain S-box-containing protein
MSESENLADSQAPPVPLPEPDSGLLRPDEDQLLAPAPAEPMAWLENGQAILDASGRITEINEPFSQWLDRADGSVAGRSLWKLMEERCPEWRERLEAFRAGKETFSGIDLKLPTDPAQTPQWFRLELAGHIAGGFVRFHSILPPLPELEETSWDQQLRNEFTRREMFLRLLRAEAQLKSLTERWPGVIFSQRADFSFRFVSPQIEALTGVSVAEWQSKPHLFWHIVHESDAEELRQQLKRARQSGQTFTSTYRVRHAQTGRVAYVMEHRQPHVSRGGLLLGYEGVWLDVTRQTIAEKRLSSAAWKETLSVLTMGLAHDFGNVMAGIHALSETLADHANDPVEFNEGLALIKQNTRQASHLVHRIINLHQGKTGESNYHNLNEITTDLADLVRKIIPRRMALAVELSSEALPVYLDVVELRQVVINLVLNAIEAMPPSGRLVLRTAGFTEGSVPSIEHSTPLMQSAGSLYAIPGTDPLAMVGNLPRLPAARLSVEDNGCGIRPHHLASIFDAFFTTKPANKSSGLGLYNARLFVEKCHGAITVDTKEGGGSTFHLWLPQADFTEAAAEARSSQPTSAPVSPKVAGQPGDQEKPKQDF